MFLFLTLVFCLFGQFRCQRMPDWNNCNCYWGTWKSWSDCNQKCYGRQVRSRAVWRYDTPECEKVIQVCDAGSGFWERRDCNTHCTYGTVAGSGSYKYCSCPVGKYGVCCDIVVTCGRPTQPENGLMDGNNFDYGSVVKFRCQTDFNLTGSETRTCNVHGSWSRVGYWSGVTPKCRFARTCRSNPCQNGGTCVDDLERYDCVCSPGWTGVHCERDIQPPVMKNCSQDLSFNTSDHTLIVDWTLPEFTDPLSNVIKVTKNYVTNSFEFPWGDFVVQYVATKPNNGLRTTCRFQVKVRPHPCPEPSPPLNGMIICNGWRQDYGRFCLTTCVKNHHHPLNFSPNQWYVCGASGIWSQNFPHECQGPLNTTEQIFLSQPDRCNDTAGLMELRKEYIEKLKHSRFNSYCLKSPQLCKSTNVNINTCT